MVVDDNEIVLESIKTALATKDWPVETHSDSRIALERIKTERFDIVLSDLQMPDVDGITLLREIKSFDPDVEVIILTGHGTVNSAVEALKLGCYDYLQKPIEFRRLRSLIERIAEKKQLQSQNLLYRKRLKDRYRYDELVGISAPMQEIYEVIDKISMSDPTVLIEGESGTGKELLAKVIHRNSSRKGKPFVPVNCGAISESLLESELFGHVKGAFTGAIRDNDGLFKSAHSGTIFLDEIGEIEQAVQVKLLRVLQEKKIKPVGSAQEVGVDVRVIAATNRDLASEIENSNFRQDLYYRLNVISIQMPPLRSIKEDIPFLINHFQMVYGDQAQKERLKITSEAMDLLMNYHWPGNVRELENVIERAFALGMDKAIRPEDIPSHIANSDMSQSLHELEFNLAEHEKNLIKRALLKTSNNKARAAELLGINQSTVYRKMQKYGIRDLEV